MTRAAYASPSRDGRSYRSEAALSPLLHLLAAWDRRLRLTQLVLWLPRGLGVGLVISLLLAVLMRLRPWLLPGQMLTVIAVLLLISAVITLLLIWFWPHPLLKTARAFDLRFGLRERVSTALELAITPPAVNSPFDASFQTLLLRDAIQQAEKVRVSEQLPLRVQWRDGVIGLGLIGLIGLLIVLPNPQFGIVAQQNLLSATVAQQISQMQQLEQVVKANPSLSDAQKAALQQIAAQTIKTLSQPGISQSEAMAALAQAEQQFSGSQAQLSSAEQQANQQAGQALSAPGAASSSAAQAMGTALQKGDLSQASKAAQALAQQIGTLSPNQTAAIAQALNNAAATLSQTDPAASNALQQAAQALQKGDAAAAATALKQAASAFQAAQNTLSQSPLSQAAQQAARQAAQAQQQISQFVAPDAVQTPGAVGTANNQSAAQNSTSATAQAAQTNQPDASGTASPTDQPTGQADAANQTPSGPPQSGLSGSSASGQGSAPQNGSQSGGQSSSSSGQQRNKPGSAPSDAGTGQDSGGSPAGSSAAINNAGSTITGSGGGSGAGQGAGGAGDNVTNGSGGSASGSTMDTNNGHGDGTIINNEHIYAPSFIGGTGGAALNPDANNPNGDGGAAQSGGYQSVQTGSATVPLTSVVGAAASQADAAMDSDHVPIGLRGVIHDYFSGLQPAPATSTAP